MEERVGKREGVWNRARKEVWVGIVGGREEEWVGKEGGGRFSQNANPNL